ncbi:hypothetical protein COU61_01375 [Candidatus Pacearchaeota archaeon CG10_big_fil_rev_8_21_14_0_10_35_13]|nr:MAG: hypothetical protein COU61_01375 [Candidatus Pacearchaeota archaeon CG10_big_fil_rev_8_21_14_0_10_35_13]
MGNDTDIKAINENLIKLMIDVNMIKRKLLLEKDPEGELSEWGKEQLEKARKTPKSEYITHEEVKKNLPKK